MEKQRCKTKILIGFGANMGDREGAEEAARSAVNEQIGEVIKASSLIQTKALLLPDQEPGSQPDFLNAVWLVETTLTAEECLRRMLEIEQALGRVRITRWGPRTVDLDLLGYSDQIINIPNLVVPHPEMHKRSFVLEPLCELDADWVHPILKKTARQLLSELNHSSTLD